MNRIFFVLIILISTLSKLLAQDIVGDYHGQLWLHQNVSLPIQFTIDTDSMQAYRFTIMNGEEKIIAPGITVSGDSIFIIPSVFQTEIRAEIIHAENGSTLFSGIFIDHARVGDYKIPFIANNDDLVVNPYTQTSDISGKWESHFSPGTSDSSYAIGIFKQNEQTLSGTFLTTTGDYRFLSGFVYENQFVLSAFDGAHLFLFTGSVNSIGKIEGMFYSGSHHQEKWIAWKNETFSLPNEDEVTTLKSGYKTFDFSFPDSKNTTVSNTDQTFKNKVLLIQISGSWCPNCKDETNYLVPLYNQLHSKGLEIVMLDFERKTDSAFVKQTLEHIVESQHIPYPVLFGGTTTNANASLPMLNAVAGYPTLIFIDRNGTVRKIETGINGPATGELYKEWKDKIELFVTKLINE